MQFTFAAVAAWFLMLNMGRSLVKADGNVKSVNGLLEEIYADCESPESCPPPGGEGAPASSWTDVLMWKNQSLLLVEVTATGNGTEALLQLAFDAYGFEMTACSMYQCSGWLPMDNFPDFAAQDAVKAIRPSLHMVEQSGSVVSEAFKSLQVDLVCQANPSLMGAGLKIGILSDTFNTLGGYTVDIASGDLPFGVTVLQESSSMVTDEGCGMAQLIHDLVPGAEIFFQTSDGGANNFAAGIQQLADAGCDVIVDDICKCAL